MIKKIAYFATFSLAIVSAAALAGQSSEQSLAQQTEAFCDQGIQTARIDWEEAGQLSEEEFERTLPTSRPAAVVAGQAYEEIDRLLKRHGPDSDVASEMLAMAASFDMKEIVDMLLEKGVPIDGNGRSLPPLVSAGHCVRHEMVLELLSRGADPNVYYGEPLLAEPMIQAIANDDRELAELLLAKGYDPCRTELADGRDLADLLEGHPELSPDDPFWGQLTCKQKER